MPDVLYEKHAPYAIFTLNRPERLNALGGTLIDDLWDAYDDFVADPQLRVGIVTGNGRAFCAGADLKEMAARGSVGVGSSRRPAMFPFLNSPKPFIAAVNGLAIGGGCELSLDCDIRICSTEAYFGLFEVKRGIIAGYAVHHMARVIPYGHAAYVILTGDRISAQDAERIGLVWQVVEPDRLIPRAVEIAELIATNAPLSIEGSKAILSFWRTFALNESFQKGDWVQRIVFNSEDAREGPRAFAEKRAPIWQGR